MSDTSERHPPGPVRRTSRRRFAALCAVGFVVMGSYSVARPPTDSLFLSVHGHARLPWVWLAVALCSVAMVTIYNRYAASVPLVRLFAVVCGISAASLPVIFFAGGVPGLYGASVFMLYVWKDIYVVFLVEIFWSYANSVYPIRTARWAYGGFLAVGTLGSICGNLGVGWLAAHTPVTTLATLWLVGPLLMLGAAGSVLLGAGITSRLAPPAPFAEGFKLLRGDRYLLLMLALIGVVQIVVNLVDYQFSAIVEDSFASTDQQTLFISQVYASIDMASLTLQICTGPLLHLLGIGGTMVAIPAVLSLAIGAFLVAPKLGVIAATKVASKAMDYSIFRAAKEILYIPLSYQQKTRGKAIVDILTYRVAKAAASAVLLILALLPWQAIVTIASLALTLLWVLLTLTLVRRYRKIAGV